MVKTHLKLWIIFLFLILLSMPWIITPDEAKQRLVAEYNDSVKIFGYERTEHIADRGDNIFISFMQGTGIGKLLAGGKIDEKEINSMDYGRKANRTMSEITNKYLLTFSIQIRGVFFRGSLMVQWLLYVGVFLIAVLMDGMTQRKVKQDLLIMNAPIKFALAFHILIFVMFTPLAYLLLPVAVTPWFMPVWTISIALPITKAISNAVKTG